MSYNNFSYYAGPPTTTEWWGQRDAQTVVPEEERPISTNKPAIPVPSFASQSASPNYSQTAVTSVEDQSQPRHEVLQGTVTQLFSNFGYINDNIIFSKSDIMGQMVQVGDKVAVDATFQPNNPTKYKGERVCKIDETRFSSNASAAPPGTKVSSTQDNVPRPESQATPPKLAKPVKRVSDYRSDAITPRKSAKSRLDKKSDTYVTSSKSKTHAKSNITNKRVSSDQSEERLSTSHSRSSVSKKSKHDSKDKSSSESDKSRLSDSKERKTNSNKKSETSHKRGASKHKLISPFNIQKVVMEVADKRKSESKNNREPKSYESFAHRELDCAAVKNQYKTLSLPDEFFHVSLKYQHSFPLNHPMKLGNNCHFKVMDKKVKSIDKIIEAQLHKVIDPEDADTTFVAKVMLLSTDDLAKLYKDTLTVAEEFDGDNKIAITKAIKFLVGCVGKDKECGIGGAWSPSLDGPDPETNPKVLINTAIRTCKAITGINLSNCSSWPKFLELHYYRPLQKLPKRSAVGISGDDVIDLEATEEPVEYREPRMETVIYYIPDVWNCMPSQDCWDEITRLYLDQLTCILCPPPAATSPIIPAAKSVITEPLIVIPTVITTDTPTDTPTDSSDEASTSTTDVSAISATDEQKSTEEKTLTDEKKSTDEERGEEEYIFNEVEEIDDKSMNSEVSDLGNQPTHHSKLVVTGMKIVDIKKELELRKLNNRGVMDQLKARLKAALEKEENEEKAKEVPLAPKPVVLIKLIQANVLSEEQKNELKKLYKMPDRPEIIVHQNCKMFSRQLKIKTMSLHSLLGYYDAKMDENTFELALFAKLFLDMLRRDAVFNIYKSIVVAPEQDLVNMEESAKRPRLAVATSRRTVNRPLLFSCTLLDREQTNKISVDDLKTLVDGLGICLSSNQLSAVLGKVKDSSKYLHYRQLTDKEVADCAISDILNWDISEDLDYIKELSMGNKALFEEEASQLESSVNEDDLERLKNELDKSERCRQLFELKVSEIKDETERNRRLIEEHSKKIRSLQERLADYKAKYHLEQTRGSRYKGDIDKLVRQLNGIDKLTVCLNKCVTDALDKCKVEGKKTEKKLEPELVVDKKKTKKAVGLVLDLTEEAERALETRPIVLATSEQVSGRGDLPGEVLVNGGGPPRAQVEVSVEQSVPSSEEFESAKASDYDVIVFEESELV